MYADRMKTVADIIDLWPSQADFASDCEAKWMTAHQWRLRDRIPPEYWSALVKAAKRRGLNVSERTLIEMTAAKKRRKTVASKRSRQAVSA